jgi:GR25 family glycosyltransferase involved in LPS biosynthesis
MNLQVFLVSWDSVYERVLYTERQLITHDIKYTVLDSGSTKPDKKNWVNIGDVRFYGQLYEALKRNNGEDYIIFMLGDATFDDIQSLTGRIISIDKYLNVGVYAPYYTNSPWNYHQTYLEATAFDNSLVIASQTDGIVTAFHKSVYIELLEYMQYLDKEVGIVNLRTGWGMDYIWCAICVSLGKFILRDTVVIAQHPHGSSYDHGKASEEMALVMGLYSSWSKNQEGTETIFQNIRRRMGSDPQITAWAFYGNSVLYKEVSNPPYHIISISNSRQHKVRSIESSVNATRLEIPSINAYDEQCMSDFYKRNPEFRAAGHWFRPGEVGCFASHYEFWKYVRDNKLECAIIFEDDCTVHNNFSARSAFYLSNVPKTFDVFSLFVHSNQAGRYTAEHHITNQIAKGYQDWSTLCYVVSLKGAEKLCSIVEEHGMTEPVDWFIFRKGHAGILETYTLAPRESHLVDIDEACVPSIDRRV